MSRQSSPELEAVFPGGEDPVGIRPVPGVLQTMAAPHVTGEDLIAAGIKPGPVFREALGYAHKLRLAGIPRDNALTQTLRYAEKAAKEGQQRKK